MEVEKRILDAKGKGEYVYDYKNDVMIFKIKDRDYDKSLEFENLIVDIDTEGYITGLRIFDATKVFNFESIVLHSIHNFEFNAEIEDNIINIRLSFTATMRNKSITMGAQNFNRQISDLTMADSQVMATVA